MPSARAGARTSGVAPGSGWPVGARRRAHGPCTCHFVTGCSLACATGRWRCGSDPPDVHQAPGVARRHALDPTDEEIWRSSSVRHQLAVLHRLQNTTPADQPDRPSLLIAALGRLRTRPPPPRGCSSHRPRSCAGTETSSLAAGRQPPSSTRSSATSDPCRPARPGHPPGHRTPHLGRSTGSTASWPASATRSAPRPSGRSSAAPAFTRRHADPDPRGTLVPAAYKRMLFLPACDLLHPQDHHPAPDAHDLRHQGTPHAGVHILGVTADLIGAGLVSNWARNLLMDLPHTTVQSYTSSPGAFCTSRGSARGQQPSARCPACDPGR